MVDVDVSLDFPVTVSSLIEIGNVPGIDESKETGTFGAVFSGEIDTTRSFLAPAPKFGVTFKASVIDENRRVYERAIFGATFSADTTYSAPAPAPQPGTPCGQDMSFFTYLEKPVMRLPLLPTGLGQRPGAEIVFDFKGRVVKGQTHIEQRMPFFPLPFRTYTFDYVITPQEQFAINHIMENTDRFLVAVPVFLEMYRFSQTVAAGNKTFVFITEPEWHLYHSNYIYVIDCRSKWGYLHEIDHLVSNFSGSSEKEAGALTVKEGAYIDYLEGGFAAFPVLIGFVDSFEPKQVNRKAAAGSLTVREYIPGLAELAEGEEYVVVTWGTWNDGTGQDTASTPTWNGPTIPTIVEYLPTNPKTVQTIGESSYVLYDNGVLYTTGEAKVIGRPYTATYDATYQYWFAPLPGFTFKKVVFSYVMNVWGTAVGLGTDGKIYQWGAQVPYSGTNAWVYLNTPTQIETRTDWVDVASGLNVVVALNSAGEVYTMGLAEYTGTSDAENTNIWTLVKVNLPPIAKIYAIDAFVCAQTAGGQIYVWGTNNYDIGIPLTHDTQGIFFPVLITGIPAIADVSQNFIGSTFLISTEASANLLFSGSDYSNQSLLNQDLDWKSIETFTRVPSSKTWKKITCGELDRYSGAYGTLAIDDAGVLYGWSGYNITFFQQATPVVIDGQTLYKFPGKWKDIDICQQTIIGIRSRNI